MKTLLISRKKVLYIFLFIIIISGFSIFVFVVESSFRYNTPVGHEETEEETLYFPEDFLWGAATASYQVEGGNIYSNWWEFEQQEGNVKGGDRTEVCLDHYNLYETDFDLASDLSLNSYRFSIEWSRIEPEKGNFNEKEIEHYKNVLEALEERKIKPMVTLWHFSLPKWFADEGAWEKKENIRYFEEYVAYVVSHLEDDVELWIPINEPMAYIADGYIAAKWPPANQDLTKVPSNFRNLVKAHKGAYNIIHNLDEDAQVGIAEHSSYLVPHSKDNIIENVAAMTIDYVWTHYLLEEVENELDFIGLHYYYKQEMRLGLLKDLVSKEIKDFEEHNLDRVYYPEGLYEILLRAKKYNLPIYITEIGVPDYQPVERGQYIREHAREIYYAIEEGIDIRGFYYWALLDSFEWSEGYNAKFGLIAVDLETLQRTVKDESWEYAEIAECGCIGNRQ